MALLLWPDPTYGVARERRLYPLNAEGPWPSLPQADLSRSHSCEPSLPQSPDRNLGPSHVHPARQKTSLDGNTTIAASLHAIVVHRTSEELLKSSCRRPPGLVRLKPSSQ